AFADDDPLGAAQDSLPAVQLGVSPGTREHLRAIARVVGVFRELEKREASIPVEDRNGDPALVPAQETEVDHGIANSSLFSEVVADALRQIAVVLADES